MILLRRGRSSLAAVSTLDIDVTLDLGPVVQRRRNECFAPWRPPIEVFETDDELVVRAELGGLTRTEVDVQVDGDELVIRGARNVARPVGHRRYHESRVRYGPFEAAVRLPFPVAVELATADYVDGFLSVALPRLAATRVAPREDKQAGGSPRGDQ